MFFTESKAALTEEMYLLIDAVVKQHQTTEESVVNNVQNNKESPNAEQPNRKGKLQFKASETEAVKEQREGLEKQKCPKVK